MAKVKFDSNNKPVHPAKYNPDWQYWDYEAYNKEYQKWKRAIEKEKDSGMFMLVSYAEFHHKEHGIMSSITAPENSKAIIDVTNLNDMMTIENAKDIECFDSLKKTKNRIEEIELEREEQF